MTAIIRLQAKGQITIPSKFRDAAGLIEGTLMEAAVERGRIVLTPKTLVDPDDTLAPEEAKRVRKGEAQLKRGRSQSWDTVKHGLGR